jgi:hypothetical protein
MSDSTNTITSSIYNAADKLASGDLGGGLGSVLAIGSGFAAPEAANVAGRGLSTVGRGVERSAVAIQNAKPLPALAGLEAILHASPKMAAIAASPYVAEWAGRGVQRVGSALQRLKNRRGSTIATVSALPSRFKD